MYWERERELSHPAWSIWRRGTQLAVSLAGFRGVFSAIEPSGHHVEHATRDHLVQSISHEEK
jgi:hypothetical protein